jgi:hypothetical protein
MKITKKITAKTTLAEIMNNKKGSKVLAKNGVPCLSCPMAQFEVDDLQIGEVCKTYGLKLAKILRELNSLK